MNAPIWLTPDGKRVSCTEKIKVMQQNMEELEQMAQDVLEDGILMGIDPGQLKEHLVNLMHNLKSNF